MISSPQPTDRTSKWSRSSDAFSESIRGRKGFALISHDEIALTFPMPETEEGIRDLFHERIKPVGVVHCQIEKVHAMPKNGAASMFKFGRNAGVLIGMLLALRIPFRETDPKVWQSGLGIPKRIRAPKPDPQRALINFPMEESKRKWKKRLMDVARNLYPGAAVTLETADALLIAEFARRDFFGILGKPIFVPQDSALTQADAGIQTKRELIH